MSSQPIYTQPQYVAYPPIYQQQDQQQYEIPLNEKHPVIGLFFFLGFVFPLIWLVQVIMYAFKSKLHIKIWGVRALCAFLFYCSITLAGFLILFGINLNQCYEHRYH
ncbi:hypothetical protein EHI2019_000490100 [Entamoeba histolytica]